MGILSIPSTFHRTIK